MARAPLPKEIENQVLLLCRRRCCICFGLGGDGEEKRGQIAHLNRDSSDNDPDNLAYLCLPHHDQYDSRTSQSKGLQEGEVKRLRSDLYKALPSLIANRARKAPEGAEAPKGSTNVGGAQTEPEEGSDRNVRIAVATFIVSVLALVAVWLVVPEFRKWSGLDKAKVEDQLNEKGTISGIVVDRDTNQGIGQASITVVGRTEQYVTEDSGNFKFEVAPDPPRRVRLRVSKIGFQLLDITVEPPVDNLVLSLHK